MLPYKGSTFLKLAQLAALSPAVFKLAGLKMLHPRNAQRTDGGGRAASSTAVVITYPDAWAEVLKFFERAGVAVGVEDRYNEQQVRGTSCLRGWGAAYQTRWRSAPSA